MKIILLYIYIFLYLHLSQYFNIFFSFSSSSCDASNQKTRCAIYLILGIIFLGAGIGVTVNTQIDFFIRENVFLFPASTFLCLSMVNALLDDFRLEHTRWHTTLEGSTLCGQVCCQLYQYSHFLNDIYLDSSVDLCQRCLCSKGHIFTFSFDMH